jgi:biotin synthase
MIEAILNKEVFSKDDIVYLLKTNKIEAVELYKKAAEIKRKTVGDLVYFRGLIEFSNICGKDCLYCGIRSSNKNFSRYNLSDKEILEAAEFAYKENYASVVLQAGELRSEVFTERIEYLLKKIKALSNGELGITISLGEQTKEVYKEWYKAGAHRYLLRIESSNE